MSPRCTLPPASYCQHLPYCPYPPPRLLQRRQAQKEELARLGADVIPDSEAEEEEQSVGARVRVNKFVGPPEGREGLGLEEKLGVTDTVGV